MPACTEVLALSTPSSAARLNVVPWKYRWPKYSSHVSACASSWTSASGPWRRARARSSARVIEWSPPRSSGGWRGERATPAESSADRRELRERVRLALAQESLEQPPVPLLVVEDLDR